MFLFCLTLVLGFRVSSRTAEEFFHTFNFKGGVYWQLI